MKYKLKIDYIPKDEEVTVLEPLIRKGEVLDVVGYSEPIQSVVCYYKKGIQVNIPLQVFLLIAEEYQEPRKPKVCVRCIHYEQCAELGLLLHFGYSCDQYEEIKETTKITPCAKCKRFEKCKQSTMNTRTRLNSGLGSCAIFEEKE